MAVDHDRNEAGVATGDDAERRLDLLLDDVTRTAGAHIGQTYLQVPERHVLQMTTSIGAPDRLAQSWSRIALAAPAPVPEAVRSRSPVWIADRQELARGFPRVALAFPYTVAMYAVPLATDGDCWGALLLMWPGSRREGLSAAELRRIGAAADRMAQVLRDATARRRPVRPREEPLVLDPKPREPVPVAALVDRFSDGFAELDRRGRMTFLTERAAHLLGGDRAELTGTDPWDAAAWLRDPAYENAFTSALVNRQPTAVTARRPDGVWLSLLLCPDATGISLRIRPEDSGENERDSRGEMPRSVHRGVRAEEEVLSTPVRAGTLFHLLHLAAALTEAAGVGEVAEALMEQMRPGLGAQGLALTVVDEGRLRVIGSRGFPPGMTEYFSGRLTATRTEGVRTVETGVPRFHRTNAALLGSYSRDQGFDAVKAFAFLPLTVSGRTFGCLILGYDRQRPFTQDERAELVSLAGVIAQALERARLHDVNAQVARGLQEGLLPRCLPHVPGVEVAARYLPATHALDVGGDFYDLIDFADHSAAAVIGDVQGHSVQAAALMGQIRTAMHSYARTGAPPEEVLAATNQLLLELDSDLLCSCLYAHVDVPGRRVLLASAGHPPPILRHHAHRAEVLDPPPGLLLGVDEDPCFQTADIPLPRGALLALYTDGLVERPGKDIGDSIGLLADQFAEAHDGRLDLLADEVVAHAQKTADQDSSDDMALLLVRCDVAGCEGAGADPARPGESEHGLPPTR
ncbi:SpoIIE family protein phosphatase [Actinacidiphila guanduensis]|uniref:protein-serine/threonine phosphatase n=1 Tax=Actinacidiphila guanduensis TaxID=310781 RepID=A0A1H0MDM4_9ACTN|nr:SpoIIE family protein phosphatase [Actinacidiphila guanduensis]SDO78457.1 Serine phosphatase RsbU, regulator of sigma subunit [Actinacidiphila guanduensis]